MKNLFWLYKNKKKKNGEESLPVIWVSTVISENVGHHVIWSMGSGHVRGSEYRRCRRREQSLATLP